MNSNNGGTNQVGEIPQELIKQWDDFLTANLPAEATFWTGRQFYLQGRKDQYLSSLPPTGEVQDKMEVLEELWRQLTKIGVDGYFYEQGWSNEITLFTDWYKKPETQSLISSLFSPAAQPTGDKPDDVIRKEGDTLLTELKKDKNHITKQLNHKNIISYNTGFHTGYMLGYKAKPQPANEPVIEPTGNWDELERRVTDEITALEGLKRPASISGLEQVLAWIGELRRQTSSKEPAPTAEDWENDFIEKFIPRFRATDLQEIIDYLKSNVPKVAVGGLQWVKASEKPEYNIGVLVFIPDEDFHITAGMWDVSNKWVLLDEYRKPECEVTHWMELPPYPEGFEYPTLPPEAEEAIREYAKNDPDFQAFKKKIQAKRDESTSLSDLIEQVRKESPQNACIDFQIGWGKALDKLNEKL